MPIILKDGLWPRKGKISAGSVSAQPWWFADVLPMCAALGGGTTPDGLDGIDVWPSFFEKDRPTPPRLLYWEIHERGFQQAVRWRHWKAIRPGKDKPLRLYHLDVDIGEGKDLASDHPAVIAKMESILQKERTPSHEWPVR